MIDPLPLAQALIRRPSITPRDEGALDVLGAELERLGFRIVRRRFGEVENLYARLGETGRNLCFAGHTDVVPVGDRAAWSVDPFAAEVRDGWLFGRGASDMKAAIAAMVAAVESRLSQAGAPGGSISFLITADEEGPAIDGTVKMLAAITAMGERLDHCLVGEPTSVRDLGDTVKNGRRGSLNALVEVTGRQGHVAYPTLALNPVGVLLDLLARLRARRLDDGAAGFDPSNLEVTSIDVGNPTHNVIPARASARFNIRFNTAHSGAALLAWIEAERAAVVALHPEADVSIAARATGEPFYTPPGDFTTLVQDAVRDATGAAAALSTSGGTSDARFIRAFCPVAELGLQNATAHMVDERVRVEDVRALALIYRRVIDRYFAG
jgi:succinyl-diaminopimelate desuccinylase